MKKLALLIVIILALVVYFNQDRDKLYIKTKSIDKYIFNEENILKQINGKNKIIGYEIDKNILRVNKKVNGVVVQKYFWQGKGKLKLVTDSKNRVLREYFYGSKYENLPYRMQVKGKKYFLFYNKLRSLKLVLNTHQDIVKIIDYDKNGAISNDSNPSFNVDFSYGGGLWDSDAKLLFFPQGTYDPFLAVWINRLKNIDILQNIQDLNTQEKSKVFTCNATLDVYYHSYICTQGRCGGLYATDYLNYINGTGYIIDNSYYFNKKRCKELSLSKKFDKKLFSQCVYKSIEPRQAQSFDAFRHNCHHEVSDIIKNCKTKARRGKS